MSAINGIGSSIAHSIVNCRTKDQPYKSLYDFYRRCDPSILKKSTLENLAFSGALDELIEDQDTDLSRRIELEVLEKEKEQLEGFVDDTVSCCLTWLREGIHVAMDWHNRRL